MRIEGQSRSKLDGERDEGGRAPEDDDDWGLGVRDEPEALPDHEPGGEHGHEVEDLQQHLETRRDPA